MDEQRMKNNLTITGIGSRRTPESILNEMTLIGKWCKRNKVVLKSGHCEGPDHAFEVGAQEYCIAILPWARFNHYLKSDAKVFVSPTTPYSRLSIKHYHPNPSALSSGGKRLMERNYFQIVEFDMLMYTVPLTKLVVCYTPDGKASGGTGQAMRIATAMKIPIVNMQDKKFDTAEKVIKRLKLLLTS